MTWTAQRSLEDRRDKAVESQALTLAAATGLTEIVDDIMAAALTLGRGALAKCLDMRNARGRTALVEAAYHGRALVCAQLLAYGASPLIVDNK